MGLCFRKKDPNWDCEKWLAETPNPACLPYKKGMPPPKGCGASKCPSGPKGAACRRQRAGEPITSPVEVGPRGGKYFYAKGVKVYVTPIRKKKCCGREP